MTESLDGEQSLLDAIAAFDAIGLDQIIETADLQTRKDRKYLVHLADVAALVDAMPGGSRVLTIDDRVQFRYCSAYFDTDDHRSYLGSARRRPSRFKVRVRTYVDSNVSMLEVKTRDKRGRTVKSRIAVEPTSEIELTAAGRGFIAGFEQTADVAWELRPMLTTTYRRSTLLLPASHAARVTIDTDLTWYDTGGRRHELGPFAIVETKTDGRASEFDRALWNAGHRPTTFSKYCTGLAALDHTLPANRWHRVLQRCVGARRRTARLGWSNGRDVVDSGTAQAHL